MINTEMIALECKKDLIDMISKHDCFDTRIEEYDKLFIREYERPFRIPTRDSVLEEVFKDAVYQNPYSACLRINGDIKELEIGLLVPVETTVEYVETNENYEKYMLKVKFVWSSGIKETKREKSFDIFDKLNDRLLKLEKESKCYEITH